MVPSCSSCTFGTCPPSENKPFSRFLGGAAHRKHMHDVQIPSWPHADTPLDKLWLFFFQSADHLFDQNSDSNLLTADFFSCWASFGRELKQVLELATSRSRHVTQCWKESLNVFFFVVLVYTAGLSDPGSLHVSKWFAWSNR